MANQHIKGLTVEIGGNTTELTAALKDVDKSAKKSSDELKSVNDALKLDPSNTTLVAQKQEVLASSIETTKKKLEILKKAEQEAQSQFEKGDIGAEQYRALQREVIYAENKLKKLETQLDDTKKAAENGGKAIKNAGKDSKDAAEDTEKLSKNLEDLKGKYNDAKDAAKDAGKELAATAAAGAAAIGGSVAVGMSYEDALNAIQIQTGADETQMQALKLSMQEVFASGLGEDLDDVAGTMAVIAQQMHETDPNKLAQLAKNALVLKDGFGFETSEQMRAVQMLVDQFGISAESAYNLIVQGAQKGLNKNGDLLDVINEYSVHYKNLGYDSDGFFNSLYNGTQTGVFSVDKLGDAMKEFGIRVIDESQATTDAYEALGLDADLMREKFAEGGKSAQEAAQIVNNALFSMQDEVAQNSVGVALYGTMWEDMGKDAIEAIGNVNGEIDSTVDAMEEVRDIKMDSTSTKWTQLGRTVQTELLVPLGEKLLPTLKDMLSYCIKHSNTLIPIVKTLGAALAAMFVVNKIAKFTNSVSSLVSTMKSLKSTSDLAGSALSTFGMAAGGAVAGAVAGIEIAKAGIKTIMERIRGEIGSFLDLSSEIRALADEYSALSVEMDNRRKVQADAIAASDAEFDMIEDLVDELDGLVDANGRVIDGNEGRVEYIKTKLADATGYEIELIDGVIQEYDNLSDTIDDVILKKRAESALAIMSEDYLAAVGAINGDTTAFGSRMAYEAAAAAYDANKHSVDAYAYKDAMDKARAAMDYNLSIIVRYDGLDYALITGDKEGIISGLDDAKTGMMYADDGLSKDTLYEEAMRRGYELELTTQNAEKGYSSATPAMIQEKEELVYRSVYEWIYAAVQEGLNSADKFYLTQDVSRFFAMTYGVDASDEIGTLITQIESGMLSSVNFVDQLNKFFMNIAPGTYSVDDIYDYDRMRLDPDDDMQESFERNVAAYHHRSLYGDPQDERMYVYEPGDGASAAPSSSGGGGGKVLYAPQMLTNPVWQQYDRTMGIVDGAIKAAASAIAVNANADNVSEILSRYDSVVGVADGAIRAAENAIAANTNADAVVEMQKVSGALGLIFDQIEALDLTVEIDGDVVAKKILNRVDRGLGKEATLSKRGLVKE